jgi:C1A family cysteine protease
MPYVTKFIPGQRKYTWKKQSLDARDYTFEQYKRIKPTVALLPGHAYNRPWCSEVKNQGQEGSCTGHAWGGEMEYNENKFHSGSRYHDLSRAFIYYNERLIDGSTSTDSGAQLRDGANALATYGVCTEAAFPYVENGFATQPAKVCYDAAAPNKIHSYYALNTLTDMRTCLASGQCFVFGFSVYESFESQAMANTGVMPMPNLQTEQLLGGHAVMAIGYNDAEQRMLIRNSWGLGWGLAGELSGYFTMPYSYLTNPNLASDFWTVIKEM